MDRVKQGEKAADLRIAVIDDLLEHSGVPARNKVGMQGVACVVTICEDERLGALVWSPQVTEQQRVPVNFVEQVRSVDPTSGAVSSVLGTSARREDHVCLVSVDTGCGVVAGWEMNVGTEGRSITIAALVGETNTCTRICRVLNTDAMKTIRIGWVKGCAFV